MIKQFMNLVTWGTWKDGKTSPLHQFGRGLVSLVLLFVIIGFTARSCDGQDLGFDPAAPQGADWIGFKSKMIGQDTLGVTMSLVCVQGQAALNTAGLTFNQDLQYWHTPGLLTMELKDAGGVVIATRVIDYWYINNSSSIDETDPIRAADPAWTGFLIPPGPDNNGTVQAPEMSQGYQDAMNFDNYEGVPLYFVLPPGTPSGNYELCATADFSYFVNESNDPAEFPDSWCRAFTLDITTGETTWPQPPPAPPTAVDVAYTPGQPVQVTFDGDPGATYTVERWTKKGGNDRRGGRNKRLNPTVVVGNSFTDDKIEGDSQQYWGTRKGVWFYYKIQGTQSTINSLD